MIGRIKKRVYLCDGHSLVRLSHLHDFVAGANLACLQDAEVEPRPLDVSNAGIRGSFIRMPTR
jgi:hypothetical protein